MNLSTYKDIKFFQSELLNANNFKHAFFTKRYKNNKPKELQKELNLTSNIHCINQIHSAKVIQAKNKLNLKSKFADSIITKDKDQSLWIYTADCVPILIADIKTRNIAACHCGLEGLKKQIISKTLKGLEDIGSKKNDFIIAIGPSIHGAKYQVMKDDVAELIYQLSGESITKKNLFIIKNIKDEEGELISLFENDNNNERLLFDIQAAAILQLLKEGIKRNQINLNRICTYSNSSLFNSYRREKTNLRQWSCIYS